MSVEKLSLIALILSVIGQAAGVYAIVKSFLARTLDGKQHKDDHDEQIVVLTRIAEALEDRPQQKSD